MPATPDIPRTAPVQWPWAGPVRPPCQAADRPLAEPGAAAAPWRPCGKPATGRWRYGCVHEHIRERWVCADHEPEPGQVGCQRCWEAGHDCPMGFRALEIIAGVE